MPGHVKSLSRIWEKKLNLANKKIFCKKGTFFKISDPQKNFFGYIRSGDTCTIYPLYSGYEYIHMLISSGCLIHETYTLAGYCNVLPMHYALSDSEIYLFDAHLLSDDDFLINNKELIKNCLYSVAQKQLALDMISNILSRKTSLGKISQYIHICSTSQKSDLFSPNITQQILSRLLNINKGNTNKTIKNMVKSGVINKFTKKECYILDHRLLDELRNELVRL